MFNIFEQFSTEGLPKESETPIVEDSLEVKPEVVEINTGEQETSVEGATTDPVEGAEVNPSETVTETVEEVENDEFSFAPVIDSLAKQDVLYYDENKEYEDSEEGFREVIKDTVKRDVRKEIEELGEEAVKAFEHIKKGGSLRDLIELEASKIDYKNIDVKDPDNQKGLITEHLAEMGYTDAQIAKKLEKLEDLGELESDAEVAQTYLAKQQEKREAEFYAKVERDKIERETAERQQIEKIEDTIFKSEDIAGFKLDNKEKEAFRDYLLKPDKTGKTQYQKDLENEKTPLELALLKFKGINASYVDKTIETKKTLGLKQALSKYKDSNVEVKAKLPVEPQRETVKLPKRWFPG